MSALLGMPDRRRAWVLFHAVTLVPLLWGEVLSLCLVLQIFGSRFLAWRRSP
jgi:hypothetical protein